MTALTILHTNDIHGRVDQLARIATLARRIRDQAAARGGDCLLCDTGDVEDPTLLESNMTKGSAVYAVLRAAGYDLAAAGNATAIRYGPQAVKDLALRFGQPLLAANLPDPATGRLVAGLAPFAILNLAGTRVAVIGLTAPMDLYALFNVSPLDPAAILPGLIAKVRGKGARTVMLLSHLGSKDDQVLAARVPGLDLILGGHSHTELYPPVMVGRTIIVQAGDRGRFLGRLDLDLQPVTGRLTLRHAELMPVTEDIPGDPLTLGAIEAERRSVHAMGQQVVAELIAPLDAAEDRQCRAGDLLADALLDRVPGAQVAMVVAGHWKTGLPAGPVSLGALNAALPSTGNPARANLTGAQIVQWLSAALRPENAARRLKMLRGVAMGMPHVAGMTVRYDPATCTVLEAYVGTERLEPDRTYVVASSDLEVSEAAGYLPLALDQARYEVPTILPEVVREYMARRSPVAAPVGDRVVAGGA
ncbi:MAG: bifunctional UDP-sugar hydrolase/5'-nucleotidase [Chloroflexota bacterium]|nr:bifunctional UDP-sugar hydrolase/5'-nucleotidase [Chloroflexota bacterium]